MKGAAINGENAPGGAGRAGAAPVAQKRAKGRRAFWLKQLRLWHWASAAVSLAGMLAFAVTGVTLNHAHQIPASPVVVEKTAIAPPMVLGALDAQEAIGADRASRRTLPPAAAEWLRETFAVEARGREAEWSAEEIYIAFPTPGGDAWLVLDRATGEALYEKTSRGAIAYLNDLHKGRNTGPAWSWFIDIFSAACVVFCLTGLVLLQIHAKGRPSTWPVAAAGVALPVLLLIFFVH